MAIGCEEVGARMMELLYGELPEGERATIQAHIDRDAGGCDRCRRELADLQRVRAQARQVLDDAPPARAHAAILRAAEAAAAARARVVPTTAPARRSSWWDRLRSGWTFPTLATVGAVAVFLLASKIFLQPDKTYQRGRQGLVPAAEAPAAQAPSPPLPATEATAANEPAPSVAPEATRPAKPSAAPAGSSPPALAASGASGLTKGAVSGKGDLQAGAPPAPHRRAIPARSQDKVAKREASDKESSAAIHPAMRADHAEDVELDRSFAPPPPPRTAQPAPVAPSAPAKKSVSASDDLEGLSDDGASGGGVRAGATATGGRAKAASSRVRTEEESASAPAPPAAAPTARRPSTADSDEETSDDDDAAPMREKNRQDATPVARADRLFAAGRWVEAVTAYRELLRRYPGSPDAPRWRQRLAAAQAAMDR